MLLTIAELAKPDLAAASENHETYKSLYNSCVAKIKQCHEAKCTQTTYRVPEFVFGRPLFNHMHAINYVAEKLRRGRFDVSRDMHPGVLLIDWKRRLVQHKKYVREMERRKARKEQEQRGALSTRLDTVIRRLKTASKK
jgi:Family of unknown function (DUF5759)